MPKALALALAAALLAGCTVGPRQARPEVALPERFDQVPADEDAATAAPLPGTALWEAFDDPALSFLVARTLEANTGIAQAEARLAEARALTGLSTFSLFPTLTAGATGSRSRASGADPFVPPGLGTIETYRAGFDASWEIDLFGSLRNPSRAIRARAEASAAELSGMRLRMVAETAQAYFALRGAQRRLALAQDNLAAADEAARLVALLFEHGRVNGLEAARAKSQRDALAAALPQREAERVAQEQRLAVLTALPVEVLRARLGEPRGAPELPRLKTVGTPEDWLKRRPDIAAAERRLAAARNDVGEEMAQFFPRLILTGAFGWTGQQFSALGESGAERWEWGPTLSWRFLDFGRVRQGVKAAEARAAGAEAQYRETVLQALEETENALAGYRASNRAASELENAAAAAREAARLARLRFEAGADDALTLLQAEQARIDLEDAAVQAQTARATALAALYKALAGDFAEAR